MATLATTEELLTRITPASAEAWMAVEHPQRYDLELARERGIRLAIRRVSALAQFWKNAASVISLAQIMAEDNPGIAADEYTDLCRQAFELRIVIMLAVTEGLVHLAFSKFPRVYARRVAEIYCEMIILLQVLFDFIRPDLSDLAREKL